MVPNPVKPSPAKQSATNGRLVWDRVVRLFHWLLVVCVAGALLTGFLGGAATYMLHIVFGTAVAALIVVRVIWGFTGTAHARFRDFVAPPFAIARYVAELLRARAAVHAGHNPLGGLMILGLLGVLLALVATGIVALGGAAKDGPLASVTSYATGTALAGLHRLLAFGLLAMIALHVAGVLLESWRTRENLVRAMITGRKQHVPERAAGAGESGREAGVARPGLAAAISVGLAAVSIPAIAVASRWPALGVPVVPVDAVFAKECGSCHTAHHPSLAPAETWRVVMAGLANHFGETATSGPDVERRVAAWLDENAAEKWDTAASNLLRRPSAREPLRITATDGWMHIHRDVADAVFASKPVAGKVNCGNCHGDAEAGIFSRRQITIPTEKAP